MECYRVRYIVTEQYGVALHLRTTAHLQSTKNKHHGDMVRVAYARCAQVADGPGVGPVSGIQRAAKAERSGRGSACPNRDWRLVEE